MRACALERKSMSLSKQIEIVHVWSLGHEIPNYDSNVWRRDDNGDVIKFSEYGNRDSEFGWEIDHIHPSALGGSDHLSNKRPLHCRRNTADGGALGNALRSRK